MNKKNSKEVRKFVNIDNNITTAASHNFSATSLKLINYGLYKIAYTFEKKKITEKYKDIDLFNRRNWNGEMFEDFTCTFSTKEFCKDLELTDGGNQRILIESALDRASEESIKLTTEKETRWYPWFVEAVYYHPVSSENNSKLNESEDKCVHITFNPGVLAIALRKSNQYSHNELVILGKLKSVYAIKWYYLINSRYNMKGKWGNPKNVWKTEPMTLKEIRELFDLPDKLYKNRTNNLIENVVNKPIKELNESGVNFHVTVDIDRGIHNKIETITLICTDIINSLKIEKYDSKEIQEAKEARNEEDALIAKYKIKYPEEWKIFENQVREEHKNDLFYMDVLVNADVLQKFKETGLRI